MAAFAPSGAAECRAAIAVGVTVSPSAVTARVLEDVRVA